MFRVVSKYRDRFGSWIVDAGPWHVSRSDAENWAVILRQLGYQTRVENHARANLSADGPDDDLEKALANMA